MTEGNDWRSGCPLCHEKPEDCECPECGDCQMLPAHCHCDGGPVDDVDGIDIDEFDDGVDVCSGCGHDTLYYFCTCHDGEAEP